MTTDDLNPERLTDEQCEQFFAAPSADAGPLGAFLLELRADSAQATTGEAGALKAFRSAHAASRRGNQWSRSASSRRGSSWSRVLTGFGATGGLLLAGGVAAAATGHLPSVVRDLV